MSENLSFGAEQIDDELRTLVKKYPDVFGRVELWEGRQNWKFGTFPWSFSELAYSAEHSSYDANNSIRIEETIRDFYSNGKIEAGRRDELLRNWKQLFKVIQQMGVSKFKHKVNDKPEEVVSRVRTPDLGGLLPSGGRDLLIALAVLIGVVLLVLKK